MVGQDFLSSTDRKGALICIWEMQHETYDKYNVIVIYKYNVFAWYINLGSWYFLGTLSFITENKKEK